jgi:hypothetical protein
MRLVVLVTLAAAAAMAAPAVGQSRSKNQGDRPALNPGWQAGQGSGASQKRRPRSPNPAWDVYRGNGEYAGSDPDPGVRTKLFFDDPTNGDS